MQNNKNTDKRMEKSHRMNPWLGWERRICLSVGGKGLSTGEAQYSTSQMRALVEDLEAKPFGFHDE
jgi:hypothetical protein